MGDEERNCINCKFGGCSDSLPPCNGCIDKFAHNWQPEPKPEPPKAAVKIEGPLCIMCEHIHVAVGQYPCGECKHNNWLKDLYQPKARHQRKGEA